MTTTIAGPMLRLLFCAWIAVVGLFFDSPCSFACPYDEIGTVETAYYALPASPLNDCGSGSALLPRNEAHRIPRVGDVYFNFHGFLPAKTAPELKLDSNVVIGQGKQFLASGQNVVKARSLTRRLRTWLSRDALTCRRRPAESHPFPTR